MDLELGASTRSALEPAMVAIENRMVEIFRGRMRGQYRAHYELAEVGHDASSTIERLADVVESLRGRARSAWLAAARRDFNIGVEILGGQRSIELALDSTVLRRVIELGGRVVFTAYRPTAKSGVP